jgi:hypothetical protein
MSLENAFQFQDNSSSLHCRTEIPNIIFDLGLSLDVIGFYTYLKKEIAMSHIFEKSIPQIALECAYSENKIRELKKVLEKPHPFLNRTSLIKVESNRKNSDGGAIPDLITLEVVK